VQKVVFGVCQHFRKFVMWPHGSNGGAPAWQLHVAVPALVADRFAIAVTPQPATRLLFHAGGDEYKVAQYAQNVHAVLMHDC
jgi:hypothetical protein